jgi:hypothetical protein
MRAPFGLFLFSTDESYVRRAVQAGVDGLVVDWEWDGKEKRQLGADTQINHASVEDLRRVRSYEPGHVICRVNNGPTTLAEVEQAIDAGADEILLPMVRDPQFVTQVIDAIAGRAAVGVLIETVQAVARAAEFAYLPIARVYVGLNDLSIERGAPSIFSAIADGTVERLRQHFTVPFGFGGLTLPTGGQPIPCRLLMAEMLRLECDFTLLRRSFQRDVSDPRLGVPLIREALDTMRGRTADEIERDHAELLSFIRGSESRQRVRA